MQDKTQLTLNGQEIQTADINAISKAASLADDRVLSELLRLAPYNGSTYAKAILPYTTSVGQGVTVVPGTGGVTISPFRAVVGSRTAVGSGPSDNWQDIRSAVYTGLTTLAATQAITANGTGFPRWDLIYVAVASDALGASVTRYVKTPATKVVAATSVVGTLTTTATIGVQPGTASATPAFPTLPSDTGATIYIPLAFVRVINGFSGATVLNNKDVIEVAPVTSLSRATSAVGMRPADQQYLVNGAGTSGAGTSPTNGINAWTSTTNTRPGVYMPPSMCGGDELLIAIDVCDASSVNWSHQNSALVDGSRDWRRRLFQWMSVVGAAAGSSGATSQFPWNGSTNPQLFSMFGVLPGFASSVNFPAFASGLGASTPISGGNPNIATVSATGAAATATAGTGANIATNAMVSGTSVFLYVDNATGNLRVGISGFPLCSVFFWLKATAPYANQ